MYLLPVYLLCLLLAGPQGVLGGSRFWEAKAPNKRTNPSPDYLAIETLNATSSLLKRAFSIENLPSDAKAPRIWPDKKIRYCFDDTNNVLIKGLLNLAVEKWSQLSRHGFKYEEVSNSVCNSQRSSVLRIYYNNYGRLSTTLGIPPLDATDPTYVGPSMHLSDMAGIGQDDIAANVAHELGHAWGLAHEHQVPQYWITSVLDNPSWNLGRSTSDVQKYFRTTSFNCQNLKDYEAAHDRVQEVIDAAEPEDRAALEVERARLCSSQVVANKYGFSAADWIPMIHISKMVVDSVFDPDSLMMYPSRAGGKGSGDARLIVMTYEDGTLIPNRLAPSHMDIDRLVTLYGTPASSALQVPHVSKSSGFRNTLRKVRSKLDFKRAGDTSAGMC
ncbi:hypothetical protein NX059_003778 [Plenodomus lindquistii]|nr:hypothetical protein NX059_003778 [Plenodomus lindquistii]